jgi:hypothetical protein
MKFKIVPYMLVLMFFLNSTIVVAKNESKVKNSKVQAVAEKTNSETVSEACPEVLTRQEVDLISFFSKPIEFTPEGIQYYFKYVYNHPEYPSHLPYSLSHMIQFLQYGIESGQNEQFAASVLNMFLQKIKAAPFVEAENFTEFLPKFTRAIKPYLEKKEANFVNEMQVIIKDKLGKIFAQYFSYFQKNPDGFMTSLAEQIAKQTNKSVTQQHVEVEHLKKDILRFIELVANKLVWSSQDDIQVWYTCTRLADECQICLDQNVLCNSEDLDDLCWSLVHRFCYFVELSHDSLSKDFFSKVAHDVKTNKNLTLIARPEREDLMVPKAQQIERVIDQCKERHARA